MPPRSRKNTQYQVLCVDDEAPLLDICAIFLEKSGDFRVTTALSAADGLKLLEKNSFDAIVSDYQMPGTDGIQFLAEVRKRLGEIPFILFTGRGREEVAILAIDNGADFYVQKGGETKAQFAELAHKIRTAITRRNAENRISESEEFLRTVITDAKEGIIVYDRELRFTLWNRFMEELTGLKAADVLGKSALQLFPFYKKNGIDLILNHALAGTAGESSDWEFFISSTGHKGWVKSVYSPNYDSHGTIIGVIGIVRDVTERKQVTEALRESEKRYRDLFDLTKAVMLIVDPGTGSIADANLAAGRYYGYSPGEFSRIAITDITAAEPVITKKSLSCAPEAQGTLFNVRHRKKNGELRDVIVFSTPLSVGGKKFFHLIIQDVTERVLAEDALRQAHMKINSLSGITRQDLKESPESLQDNLAFPETKQSDLSLNECAGEISGRGE